MSRILLTALLAVGPAIAAGARPVTVDELMRLDDVSNVCISPDGRRVLFVVSHADSEADAWVPVLWEVSAAGGEPRRLSFESRLFNRPLPNPQVDWSPDGGKISFLAFAEDGTPQVFALAAGGGEAQQLTRATGGVIRYAWASDSRGIAYLSPEPVSEDEARRREEKRDVILVDREDLPARLWALDEPDAEARVLTPLEHFVTSFDVSPEAPLVAYAAAPGNGFTDAYRTRIYVVPWAGGEPRVVVDRAGMNDAPLFSPDGRTLAFRTSSPGESILTNVRLALVPAAGGTVREIHRHADQWIGQFLWAADGKSLYYFTEQASAGSGAQMFEQQIFEITASSGEVRARTSGRRVNSWLSLTRDGSTLAFKSSDATSMGDIVLASTEGWEERRITDLHPEMRELDWGSLEPISWRSFDGMEIWGLLLLPPGYEEGSRIPVVVYCHGGPVGGFSYAVYPQFSHIVGQVSPYPVQALASAGMGVLLPMPRGGSGYGEAGFRMIVGSWGEGDYRDIMAGVDHLIAEGIADPRRLGVMGASYGGYMTSWIVTQTDRFAAASTGASVTDLARMWSLSDAGEFLEDYFGKPWEEPEAYARHSAVTHAASVTTPLLIQHGEMDFRVPVSQAKEYYELLRAMGKTVELEIYPRGGHVTFEPDLQREEQQRNLNWFRHWLLPDGERP